MNYYGHMGEEENSFYEAYQGKIRELAYGGSVMVDETEGNAEYTWNGKSVSKEEYDKNYQEYDRSNEATRIFSAADGDSTFQSVEALVKELE